ncbi:unnamed protein product, partial [Mesorhabditis belari]|uniref:Uncharacterized protein n=1 Tax=Mesorhabditis belari TaxID=2138241 RepID=A0AAF3J2U4_9BILA
MEIFKKNENAEVECDFVRVECFDAQNKTIDQTLHTQIVETTQSVIDPSEKITPTNTQLSPKLIFREFERIGYKTFYSEEYIEGSTFTYPKCKGFKNREAHHLFRPFVSSHHKESVLKNYMSTQNCFEMHKAQLDYHAKFMRAYKKKPKFGLTWVGALAHDDTNALFHADEDFEKLFKSNADVLSNSFVIFMSDHGMRVGATLQTELGQREQKNPMFLMILPKWLRDNQQLLQNLRINSRKLLTQFDVHATLLDIMNMTITNEFNDFTERPIFPNSSNPNNATSFLRPDPNIEKGLAEFGVEEINKILEKNKIPRKCDRLKLKNVEKTIVYLPANQTNLYMTTFIAEPGLGHFKMAVRVGEGGTLRRASGIERLNSFGIQPRCIEKSHPDFRHLCHCNGRGFLL